MKLKEFLRSKVRLEILNYLKNSRLPRAFIDQISKALNYTWGSIYRQSKILLNLGLVEVEREEKARGKGMRRKAYSITKKGLRVLDLLEEIPKIKRKLSLLLKED